jgi:hypothetical protein
MPVARIPPIPVVSRRRARRVKLGRVCWQVRGDQELPEISMSSLLMGGSRLEYGMASFPSCLHIAIAAAFATLTAPAHASPPATVDTTVVKLGPNASLAGQRPFPDDNIWNTSVTHVPVDPSSAKYIASIGANRPLHPDFGANWHGGPFGIPYVVVPGSTPRVPLAFTYADESDRDWYPIPPNPPIERGDDSHVIVIDRDNWRLFEVFGARLQGDIWRGGSGAVFDLSSNALRPAGYTSADAAGLPIFPGLVRYDEVVERKEIRHALRFTATRTQRAYCFPARHHASKSDDPSLPPMGLRVRLKRSFDLSSYPPQAQVVLRALKEYGMILADNGGDWFISGAPDSRWNDGELNTLKRVKGSDFEAVLTGALTK